eukprot:5702294-Pleurochrysis_carterae.AAC.4
MDIIAMEEEMQRRLELVAAEHENAEHAKSACIQAIVQHYGSELLAFEAIFATVRLRLGVQFSIRSMGQCLACGGSSDGP